MKVIPILLAALLLSGCAERLEQYGRQAVEEKKAYNDTKARGLISAQCDMSIGAFYRALSPKEQCSIAVLCGGQCSLLGQSQPTSVFLLPAEPQ